MHQSHQSRIREPQDARSAVSVRDCTQQRADLSDIAEQDPVTQADLRGVIPGRPKTGLGKRTRPGISHHNDTTTRACNRAMTWYGRKWNMEFKKRTLMGIADMICGNFEVEKSFFRYRSSTYLTEFFQDCGTGFQHDGSTRKQWVAETLRQILAEPHSNSSTPPESFLRVIRLLMDPGDAVNEGSERPSALALLNSALAREGFEAFYARDKQCYLRHIGTGAVASAPTSPHRPFTTAELKRRELLTAYLENATEDALIEEVLLPLFRQLGFHRVTAAGHKDKTLEYGKDLWMKFTLPSQHVLYFGIQAKRGKLDASGVSQSGSTNIAEIHNQVTMMLGHEVFDPEIGKRVLVDHAFIVAGGEITKAARNWLGNKLDASKRSQILFMDRDDILNLFVVTNLPLPKSALPVPNPSEDDLPF
jgi:hypothetical protein